MEKVFVSVQLKTSWAIHVQI